VHTQKAAPAAPKQPEAPAARQQVPAGASSSSSSCLFNPSPKARLIRRCVCLLYDSFEFSSKLCNVGLAFRSEHTATRTQSCGSQTHATCPDQIRLSSRPSESPASKAQHPHSCAPRPPTPSAAFLRASLLRHTQALPQQPASSCSAPNSSAMSADQSSALAAPSALREQANTALSGGDFAAASDLYTRALLTRGIRATGEASLSQELAQLLRCAGGT